MRFRWMPLWWYVVLALCVALILACNPFNADMGMPSPRMCGRHTEWMFGQYTDHSQVAFRLYAKGRWVTFTQGLEYGEDNWHYRMTLQNDDKLMFIYSHIGEPNVMQRLYLKRTRTCRWDGESFTFKKVGGR